MDDDSFDFKDDGWGDDGLDDLDDVDHDDINDDVEVTRDTVMNPLNVSNVTNTNVNVNNYPPSPQKKFIPPPPTSPPPKHALAQARTQAQTHAQKLSSDVSSFDDDDMNDDDWDWNEDDDANDDIHHDMDHAPPPPSFPPPSQHPYQSPRRPPPPPPQVPPPPLEHPPQVTIMNMSISSQNNQSPPMAKMEKKLLQYVSKLTNNNNKGKRGKSKPTLLQSINHKFQTLKNNHNPETALQLCRYYHQRPHLTAYTIDTEVPRMEYRIMVSDEVVLFDQSEIQAYFQFNPIDNLVDDMLLRASNQSLLADLFPIITSDEKDEDDEDGDGDDLSQTSDISSNLSLASSLSNLSLGANNTEGNTETADTNVNEIGDGGDFVGIIQSQFFATAVATKCKFVLDMRKGHDRTTQVECVLTISIPCQSKQSSKQGNQNNTNKLDIATARFMVHFSPQPNAPFVKYHLISIQPLVSLDNPTDLERIRNAAKTIQEMTAMMQPDDDDVSHDNGDDMKHDPNYFDHERDHFLQSIISTQTTGFKSALQEIDSVVNVKSKFNFIKDVLPVLPSADDIMMASDAAADETVDQYHPHQHQQQHQQQQRTFPPPPPPPFPPHQRQQQQQQPQQHNPKAGRPIIGGLLLSGISHLAEKVTAPDIEKTASAISNNSIPKLYRKDNEIENDNNINTMNGIPKLYRKDDEIENDIHRPSVQQQQMQTQHIDVNNSSITPDDNVINDNVDEDISEDGDGWSDDDIDDLDDIDNENADNVNNVVNNDGNDHVPSKAVVPSPPTYPPPPKVEKQKVGHDIKYSFDQTKQSTSASLGSSSTPNIVTQQQQQQQQQQIVVKTVEDEITVKMNELMKIKLDTNTYVPDDFVYEAKTGIIPTRSRFVPHSDLLSSL